MLLPAARGVALFAYFGDAKQQYTLRKLKLRVPMPQYARKAIWQAPPFDTTSQVFPGGRIAKVGSQGKRPRGRDRFVLAAIVVPEVTAVTRNWQSRYEGGVRSKCGRGM